MTIKLALLRHAKSSWDDPTLIDHARPLNNRGRKAAPLMGEWLADHIRPDLILCSDAKRTVQTAEATRPALGRPPLELRPDLYHASPNAMLDLLQQQSASQILLIGHNPGIGELANCLAQTLPDHPRFADFPTAAAAVFTFPGWDRLAPRGARLTAFTVPRDLAA